MLRLFFLSLYSMLCYSVFSQSTENYLALFFKENTSSEQRKTIVRSLGVNDEKCSHFVNQPIAFINCPADSVSIFQAPEEVDFVTSVKHSSKGDFGAYNSKIFVVLRHQNQLEITQKIAAELGLNYIGANEFLPHIITLKCPKYGIGPLAATELLNNMGLFKLVTPGVLFSVADCSANDTHYNRQWALKNNGTALQGNGVPGADIDAELAWEITTGSANIKIAILDSGIDTLHNDLSDKLLPGYDAMGSGTNGYPTPNFAGDGHGTACAGIAGASTNNNIGVAGVCPDCSLVPIKIFAYENIFGNILPFSNAESFLNGISWQWQVANVDVSSNSWGLTDDLLALFPGQDLLVNEAITSAVENGRDGLGLSMIFSSGNTGDLDEEPIWPARNANTLAVNATSMCDERKSLSSCDNENWEGNWGPGLDVSAPGVKISTTDMMGANGYNASEYTHSFNGTSAACPIVAGVAGLILSEYSYLSRLQLEGAIKRGCEKVGGYDYSILLPEGSWCPETGHGRINALFALQEAQVTGFNEIPGEQYVVRTMSNFYEIAFSTPVMWTLFDISGRTVISGQKSPIVILPFDCGPTGIYVLMAQNGLVATRIKLVLP
jgi:subtilisin family serine protease